MVDQTILLQKTIESLHSQDRYLNEKDKKDFPLIFRAISTINDFWNSNRVSLQKVEVESITPDMVRMQVNDCPPVTYITCETVPCHE